MAVAFAERTFRLEQFGIDQSLDHDLGVGRHVEIDGDGFRHPDRRAGERARDRHLVQIDRRASSRPVNIATGAQPMTMAHGIGSPRWLCFFQCR